MRQRTLERAPRVALLGCVAALLFAGGCAPALFAPAIAYQARKTAVTDSSARHTTASPYYRFDTDLLSDLDDALACSDESRLRAMAGAVLRGANELSQASNANEMERMPVEARKQLAAITGGAAVHVALRPGVSRLASSVFQNDLRRHFSRLAGAALERDLRDVDLLTPSELHRKLSSIRDGVERLPDDKGRLARRVLLAWAGPLTAMGIARLESDLPEKCLAKAEHTFTRLAVWRPVESGGSALLARYAPIIGVEWPANRPYDTNFDRIGGVNLLAEDQRIEVRIDPTEPTVYAYLTVAKIDGQRLRQLNYVWWFSDRPEMTRNDPVAGHVDGSMLRITLDNAGEPIFMESSLNCGCGHEVFVSERIESAAREAFGAPLTGKRFSVEKRTPGKHDVVVIHPFAPPASPRHPFVLVAAGYHEVIQVSFQTPQQTESLEIAETARYQLTNYSSLDALPLGDGIASMFGPDGLVHGAGRLEGYLLAPSGILSAGQPRKRGTQRIRWDDYVHDDPHLLETTLRLPPLD